MSNSANKTNDIAAIRVCPHPYPYKAMLAICSDLDETPSSDVYFNTVEFLNSSGSSEFGRGLDLEVGNTMYFHMPPKDFSYWNATDYEQGRVRELMKLGLIDCFHSFGDLATERRHAGHVLDHLEQHDCRLRVWVDHATAPTNLGPDIMRGYGDVESHAAYHADLTLAYGVKYTWLGRVTSMQGQDARPSLRGIIEPGNRLGSSKTAAMEAVKISLGALGSKKYKMHTKNHMTRKTELRDGQGTIEFLRTNPNPLGVSAGDTAKGLAEAIRDSVIDRIVKRGARAIFYTHLGKEIQGHGGFPPASRRALERLADRYLNGEILVTTTRRILDYCSMVESVRLTVHHKGNGLNIEVTNVDSDVPLEGLSLTVPKETNAHIIFGKQHVKANEHLCEEAGMKMLTIPWRKISYA